MFYRVHFLPQLHDIVRHLGYRLRLVVRVWYFRQDVVQNGLYNVVGLFLYPQLFANLFVLLLNAQDLPFQIYTFFRLSERQFAVKGVYASICVFLEILDGRIVVVLYRDINGPRPLFVFNVRFVLY